MDEIGVSRMVLVSDRNLLPKLAQSDFSFDLILPKASLLDEALSWDYSVLVHVTGSVNKVVAVSPLVEVVELGEQLLLVGDENDGVYFSRESGSLPTWPLPITQKSVPLPPVFTEKISTAAVLEFVKAEKRGAPVRIGPVNPRLMNRVQSALNASYAERNQSLRDINRILRSTNSLDEVSFSSGDAGEDPFWSTAERIQSWLEANNLIKFHGATVGLPQVDGLLRAVQETDYAARTFGPQRKHVDPEKSRIALERAEATHQLIFREASEHIQSLGYKPMMSSSIDLAIQLPNYDLLIEIKSATTSNFQSQFFSGLMQLLSYRFALKEWDYQSMHECLLIELPQGSFLDLPQLRNFSTHLGINLVLWDVEIGQGNRFDGLTELIESTF